LAQAIVSKNVDGEQEIASLIQINSCDCLGDLSFRKDERAIGCTGRCAGKSIFLENLPISQPIHAIPGKFCVAHSTPVIFLSNMTVWEGSLRASDYEQLLAPLQPLQWRKRQANVARDFAKNEFKYSWLSRTDRMTQF